MSTSQDSATEIVYPEGTLEPVLREKSQRQTRLTEKGKAQNRDYGSFFTLIWDRGHTNSLKLVSFWYGFLFALHSNYGTILYHFRDKVIITILVEYRDFFILACIRRSR